METTREVLQARESYLLQLKAEKEKAITNAPNGTLRISNSRNRTQFYQRIDPSDFNGSYLGEKEFQTVKALAQKDYDSKVLRAIEKELNAIHKFSVAYPEVNAEQIYEKLHEVRQRMVNPIREPEEEYVQSWEFLKYQGKGFDDNTPELYTIKGERVRSKSELIIADLLNREGIPYRYEYPIYFKGVGMVYPDFTVLNVKTRTEMYWEHLGMMDDTSYTEKAIKKIETCQKNGIFPGEKLILTYETRKSPLSQKQVVLMIQHYLK